MDKTGFFKNELGLIKNERIKQFAITAINDIPDYFFIVPASSSGKNHPQYALLEGGLVRHTKAAVIFSQELLKLDKYKFTDDEKDLIVVALILHDSRKSGEFCEKQVMASDSKGEAYISKTLPEHPLLAVKAILSNTKNCSLLSKDELTKLTSGIASHMGQWNKDFSKGLEILPVPKTCMQELIHLCDYLASRKTIEVNFSAFEYTR